MQLADLAGGDPGHEQRGTADDHLDARRDERPARQRGPMRREQRPARPRDRRDQDRGQADRLQCALPTEGGRSDEDRDADEADDDPDDRQPRKPLAEEDPTEDGDPDRHHRDQQRRDPGRHGLLAEGDHPHPAAESSAPTIALSRHSRRVGGTKARPSRAIDQASRRSPAERKRTPAIRNGGIVSTAIAIPRYVEPQTT